MERCAGQHTAKPPSPSSSAPSMCASRGDDDARSSCELLWAFRARKYRSVATHLPLVTMFANHPYYHIPWDSCSFYDTRPDLNASEMECVERVSRLSPNPGLNYIVLGTKWKKAFLTAAADRRWSDSPDNKVGIEWFDDADDPKCPPCAVCGEFNPTS